MYSDLVFFGGAVLGVVVGLIYFRAAAESPSLQRRIGASAYAPAMSLVYLISVLGWPKQLSSGPSAVYAYYALQAIPFAFFMYSLCAYPGPRKLHFALVPLAAVAWLWMFMLGYWGVHGK